MKTVKFTFNRDGTVHGMNFKPGETREFPDDTAEQLAESEVFEIVEEHTCKHCGESFSPQGLKSHEEACAEAENDSPDSGGGLVPDEPLDDESDE